MNDYAMYLRKSRADLTLESFNKLDTLENHEHILTSIAADRGYHISEVFKEVVSGESIDSRPEMQKLLEKVYAGKFKGVLVFEVERLARGDTMDQGIVAEAFKMSNTLIITPIKIYDPDNESDEDYFEFGLFMSRREYKTIRRRMNSGTMISVEKGNFIGRFSPYGFDKFSPNRKEHTLVFNDETQYGRMIYDWWIDERMTTGEIAKRLQTMGVPTRSGGEWDRSTIEGIIKNPANKGYVRWGKKKTVKVREEGKNVKKRVRSENPTIKKGSWEGFVSEERWDLAQTLFKHVPIKIRERQVNPLAGLIFCKHCGLAMRWHRTVKGGKEYQYRITHLDRIDCKVKSMPASDVMEMIADTLQEHIEDFEVKIKGKDTQSELVKYDEMIASMEKELAKQKDSRNKLFDYFEKQIYTEAEFMERKTVAIQKIQELEENIAHARENRPMPVNYEERIHTFHQAVDYLRNPDADAKEVNLFLKEIIEKITYDCEDLGRGRGGIIDLEIFLK